MNSVETPKKIIRKLIILLLIGVALSAAIKVIRQPSPDVFVADACFTIASVFFCYGLGGLIRNMGGLDMIGYSFRQFHKVFRGEKKDESYEKNAGGYYQYRQTRKKSHGLLWVFLCAAVFMIAAIVVTP